MKAIGGLDPKIEGQGLRTGNIVPMVIRLVENIVKDLDLKIKKELLIQ